jgi:hypothetical protein
VTLTRNQLVLVILIVVAACGVGVAIYYVEHVFKERETEADLIKQGRAEELVGKPPPKPPGPPPLERSTSRKSEVLTLWAPKAATETRSREYARQVVSIRGNGEFVRLPALPDEPGPVVSGTLDRARVDELIRAAEALPKQPKGTAGAYGVGIKGAPPAAVADAPLIKELTALAGKQMNKSDAPVAVGLRLVKTTGEGAVPWPFADQKPSKFSNETGASLTRTGDHGRFREGLLKLAVKGARFSFQGEIWEVAELDLTLTP